MSQLSHKLYNNPVSKFAGVMAIMAFIITALLLLLDYVGVELNPIIGMMTYTLFPAALLFWLILIPVGMYLEWRRRHRKEGTKPPKYPRFDFNVSHQRTQLYIFIMIAAVVSLLIMAVSFRAYEFTESFHFCGELCHTVMQPEATTYKNSPHARVRCVQCHVGSGATWYVKSKLAGLYQVYATLFNKYPKPIETPIKNLRPSIDTCEQCHWPAMFFGSKQVMQTYYQEDEANTPRQIFMLMNVGGGISPTGIHWHVGKDEISYIARDEDRQDIPWVQVKYEDGKEVTYTDVDNPLSGEEITKGEIRKMDCMDCHNRPTHIFKSPKRGMDEAITRGEIDESLPYIKKLGVELLSKEYTDTDEANSSINDGIIEFYAEKYPQLAKSRSKTINNAVAEVQKIWGNNFFPAMKSNWSVYPNNLGHLTWPGCFRCHGGKHKDARGGLITKDCNVCHIFVNEQLRGLMSVETAIGKSFEHPIDIGGEEKNTTCLMCHAGN